LPLFQKNKAYVDPGGWGLSDYALQRLVRADNSLSSHLDEAWLLFIMRPRSLAGLTPESSLLLHSNIYESSRVETFISTSSEMTRNWEAYLQDEIKKSNGGQTQKE
jgi:hypothetical protein